MADELDFFVSYTGQDVNWATWVAAALEGEGYRVIVQEWHFQVGNFMSQMEDAVQRARYLLPVLSEAYLKSKYAWME